MLCVSVISILPSLRIPPRPSLLSVPLSSKYDRMHAVYGFWCWLIPLQEEVQSSPDTVEVGEDIVVVQSNMTRLMFS